MKREARRFTGRSSGTWRHTFRPRPIEFLDSYKPVRDAVCQTSYFRPAPQIKWAGRETEQQSGDTLGHATPNSMAHRVCARRLGADDGGGWVVRRQARAELPL